MPRESRAGARSANRIREFREARGLSLAQLAQRLVDDQGREPDRGTVHKLEKGAIRLSMDWVERIARALDVDPVALVTAGVPGAPVRRIPLVGRIPAGDWRQAIEEPIALIPYEGGGVNAFALTPDGDSMNAVVPEGAYVIVDPDDRELRDGRLYAVMRHDGDMTFKRWHSSPARLEPVSTNKSHRAIIVGDEPFHVVGRIVAMGQRFD